MHSKSTHSFEYLFSNSTFHGTEAIEQLVEEAKNGKGLHDNPSLKYLQELLPYCPQYYTDNVGRDILADLKTTGRTSPVDTMDTEMNVPQPAKCLIELKIPHIVAHASNKIKKEIVSNCKKAYTDEELTAAVSEIQSGKLGTRRASVLYGIPRSTLRNKIFKLGNEKLENLLSGSDSLEEDHMLSSETAMKWSELIQGNHLPLSLPQLPFNLPLAIKQESDSDMDDWDMKLDRIRKKHNLNGKKELYRTDYAHELKMPLLADIIRKLAEERLDMERNASRVRDMNKEKINANLEEESAVQSLKRSSLLLQTALASSDIKIPSYRPIHSQNGDDLLSEYIYPSSYDKLDNSRIGETLKDIIVKTISEKVRVKSQALTDFCQGVGAHILEPREEAKLNSCISTPSSSASASPSPTKRIKREEEENKRSNTENIPSTSSSSTALKKTRPKRGQYRKYNSQLLTEAVKAVQRGEMSVHRAGSYYGVPHSTLEYKVKERHLLRQKRIKEQKLQKEAAASSGDSSSNKKASNNNNNNLSCTSSSNSNSSSNTSPAKLETSKQSSASSGTTTTSSSWFPPYLSSSSPLDAASTGSLGAFYNPAAGFALNTPASELLRKLQHKVQSKANSLQENSYELLGGNSSLGEGYLFIN
ncbi:hypothetical protein KUTeg_005474 [Tegillarca granosa]|uniref:HTH psq-type domain-containing protein n=1 Tax=Tegillarca granosa TaxID=220873 RepID=A0ABQ9FJW7_TEGGR|nr:hypothetical protein KUTeg_005474 [Tegillarca granosa]